MVSLIQSQACISQTIPNNTLPIAFLPLALCLLLFAFYLFPFASCPLLFTSHFFSTKPRVSQPLLFAVAMAYGVIQNKPKV